MKPNVLYEASNVNKSFGIVRNPDVWTATHCYEDVTDKIHTRMVYITWSCPWD